MPKYIAYCRKSTDDEDHQVLSIESQQLELNKFAERERLQVIEMKYEARSAKTPGRPIFDEMISAIERGDADGILAWHPDRLARNALDGGMIIHLLDTGKLVDLKSPTYTFENTSQGKFMLSIVLSQSKYQVDALSDNVRRGNRIKREKGWLPGRTPLGYLNGRSEAGEKIVVPDPMRFPLVKKLWELCLTGAYSVPQLCRTAKDLGLHTRKTRRLAGQPIGRTGVYAILKRPFYTGHIVYKGTWHPARHEPMITIDQFTRVQRLLRKDTRSRPKRQGFAYAGLMKCGTCRSSVTAEEHHNRYGSRYLYYHCTHKNRNVPCRERSVEEANLDVQLLVFLDRIHLDRAVLDEALAAVDDLSRRETSLATKEALEQTLVRCHRSIDNLTRLRCLDLIDDDQFVRQRAELVKEKETILSRQRQMDASAWIEPSRDLFLFSNRARYWLLHGDTDTKRTIVSTVGSNLLLTDKKLRIDARKPFHLLEAIDSRSVLCTIVTDVRTFFETGPYTYIPKLPDIPVSHV